MKQMDLSLILPCYNEASHFEKSVARIMDVLKRSGLTYEVIFVDDYSTDITRELILKTVGVASSHTSCNVGENNDPRNDMRIRTGLPRSRKFARNDIKFRAIFHKKNYGRGRSVCDGIKLARGKIVGYIDIDMEVSPIYIPELVSPILDGDADITIGKRVYRTTTASIFREILSVGYQSIADWLIGTGKIDTESGYKFFNRKKILPVIRKTRHPHWFWDTEVVVLARREGLKITEVPVLFLRRFDKKSTVRVWRDSVDYLVSLRKFRKRLVREV